MLVIGLTGGIGSGKSTVAGLFAAHGVPIIDTDLLAREVTEPGKPALVDISKHFGASILHQDGSLNRAKLRDCIFNNENERVWLEKRLHPLIISHAQEALTKIQSPYAIVVIPLLFESDPINFIDRVLVVDSSEDNQIQRTITRDNTNREAVMAILKSQLNREKRLDQAHDIIQNDGSLENIHAQVDKLHQIYLQLSQAS
jgi:dephospho-CoA kinase